MSIKEYMGNKDPFYTHLRMYVHTKVQTQVSIELKSLRLSYVTTTLTSHATPEKYFEKCLKIVFKTINKK